MLLNQKASPGQGWAGSELVLRAVVAGGGRCEQCLRSVLEERARGIFKAKLLPRTGLHWISLWANNPAPSPGALTTFSWARLFCAPVAVQISILSAPGVFPGLGCVFLPVEMSLHPRKCH